MVTTAIDLDADGLQRGYLDVPVSLNDSAWSNQRVPLFCAKRGPGPGLLLLGGAHGDEYEGPIALSKLIHDGFDLDEITGTVIILPALSTPAVLNGTRLSPLDGGNMNRAFPGDPMGSATERVADFVTRELIPRADVVVDLHSGGRSLRFMPCTIVPMQETAEATQPILALSDAFAAPLTVVLRDSEVATMIDAEVAAQGKLILATELGGSGTVTRETVSIAWDGVLGVLDHMGIRKRTSPAPGAGRTTRPRTVHVDGIGHYVYADEHGVLEPLVPLGATVGRGDEIGRLHRIDRVDCAPVPVRAGIGGVLFCTSGQGLVRRGDVVGVIGSPGTPAPDSW